MYTLKKGDGTVLEGIERRRLRHRVFYTTAFACITDEKRHDGYTTSHFLNKMLNEHWRERIESGEFWAFIGHSDNASHFKSGQMLNYWSEKKSELGLKFLRVDFGCPGHGKGPWDGLGAVLKQTVARDSLNQKILTESGYITSPLEVSEHLKRRVDTDDWRAAHRDKTIKRITVIYTDHAQISERPVNEHDYEALTGKMTSFSYLMLGREQIARRERSCWCGACMLAHQRDSANMRLDAEGEIRCMGCESGQHCGGAAYPWREQTIKMLGTGIGGRRKEAQAQGKDLAKKLKPGEFFAVQARQQWSTAESVHERPGHFWVAQAASNFRVATAEKRMTLGGTVFSKGDLIIRIGRYFDRDISDTSGLTFEEWQPITVFSEADIGKTLNITGGVIKVNRTTRADVCWGDFTPEVNSKKIVKVDSSTGGWVELQGAPRFRNPPSAGDFVVNATELRAVAFSMTPLGRELPLREIAVRRRGSRAAVVSVPPAPLPKRYILDPRIDSEIRAKCW